MDNARGCRIAAILASFTSTCRCPDVDPQLHLKLLLINLPVMRMGDLPDWLPERWKSAQKNGWPHCKITLRTFSPSWGSRNAHRKYMRGQVSS